MNRADLKIPGIDDRLLGRGARERLELEWEVAHAPEQRQVDLFLGKDLADIRETNVPEIRISYRQATLDYELATVKRLAAKAGK